VPEWLVPHLYDEAGGLDWRASDEEKVELLSACLQSGHPLDQTGACHQSSMYAAPESEKSWKMLARHGKGHQEKGRTLQGHLGERVGPLQLSWQFAKMPPGPVVVGQRAGQILLEINAQSAVTGLDQGINTLAVDLWQGSVSKKRLVRRLLAAVSANAGNLSLKGQHPCTPYCRARQSAADRAIAMLIAQKKVAYPVWGAGECGGLLAISVLIRGRKRFTFRNTTPVPVRLDVSCSSDDWRTGDGTCTYSQGLD